MARRASEREDLPAAVLEYPVHVSDPAGGILAAMMHHAVRGLKGSGGTAGEDAYFVSQWKALIPLIRQGDPISILHGDGGVDPLEQFQERMEKLVRRLGPGGRVVVIVDADPAMHPDSVETWKNVVRILPAGVNLIFPQGPEDPLVGDPEFPGMGNVVRIPEGGLGPLGAIDVDEYVRSHCSGLDGPVEEILERVAPYDGHPYSIAAAVSLACDGMPARGLPESSAGICRAQWLKVCQRGQTMVRIFEASAVLEVPVPPAVLESIALTPAGTAEKVLEDLYSGSLLRTQDTRIQVFHPLLRSFILEQIPQSRRVQHHKRVIEVFRTLLAERDGADLVAAVRLPEHVRAVKGKPALVRAILDESVPVLRDLGAYDVAIDLCRQARAAVERGGEEEAMILGTLGVLHRLRGQLDKAEKAHSQALRINTRLGRLDRVAGNLKNLALICQTRSNLEQAEDLHRRALEVQRSMQARAESTAKKCARLALLLQTRGRPERSKRLHRKAVEIERHLGALEESTAKAYANLGLIAQARGNLGEAEKMHRRALQIQEQLGNQAGMAEAYGKLGLVYQARGELDWAEEMHTKALEIDENLGHLEGMAVNYGHLGLIHRLRGDLVRAESMHRNALEIERHLGRAEQIANQYGNLGLVYRRRGDLGEAEEMHLQSLEINRDLHRLAGIATDYGNLGLVYRLRGDLDEAEEMFRRSLAISTRRGFLEGVANQCGNLGLVCEDRGDRTRAQDFWGKARTIYAKIGMPHMVKRMDSWLGGLNGDEEAGASRGSSCEEEAPRVIAEAVE
jgi:tetratricopeptide (TPR) repeat protein